MHPAGDYVEILSALRSQGFTLTRTAEGHWRAASPNPAVQVVFFAVSAERRAMKNTIALLRRAGLAWPPPPPESGVRIRGGSDGERKKDDGP